MASEEELAGVRPRLLGLVAEERIARVAVDRPAAELVVALRSLGDLCSTVSDVLDGLGVGGGVAASTLVPRVPGSRVVGPAITLRYAAEAEPVATLIARGERAKLGDRDLYGIGQPGDVAVFDCGGFSGASAMGGLSARWARRLGIAGCVVDGAVRDIDAIREHGVPVWSRGATPVSGKHRLEAIELNGPVSLAGLAVSPGDVVVADSTGVCVIPRADVERVVERCLASEQAERSLIEAIDGGAPPEELVRILSPERW